MGRIHHKERIEHIERSGGGARGRKSEARRNEEHFLAGGGHFYPLGRARVPTGRAESECDSGGLMAPEGPKGPGRIARGHRTPGSRQIKHHAPQMGCAKQALQDAVHQNIPAPPPGHGILENQKPRVYRPWAICLHPIRGDNTRGLLSVVPILSSLRSEPLQSLAAPLLMKKSEYFFVPFGVFCGQPACFSRFSGHFSCFLVKNQLFRLFLPYFRYFPTFFPASGSCAC